jgi:uncharacterized protein
MFKELRRKERLLEEDKAYKLLKDGEYGILSMSDSNGYGYGIPLNYVLIGKNIYFHCAKEGSKIEAIRNNNKVSFCVVGSSKTIARKFTTAYESVIIFGKASEVENKEKEDVLIALIEKFSQDFMEEGKKVIAKASSATKVIRIEIENICGKCNNGE